MAGSAHATSLSPVGEISAPLFFKVSTTNGPGVRQPIISRQRARATGGPHSSYSTAAALRQENCLLVPSAPCLLICCTRVFVDSLTRPLVHCAAGRALLTCTRPAWPSAPPARLTALPFSRAAAALGAAWHWRSPRAHRLTLPLELQAARCPASLVRTTKKEKLCSDAKGSLCWRSVCC